jgi:hypothetical protein
MFTLRSGPSRMGWSATAVGRVQRTQSNAKVTLKDVPPTSQVCHNGELNLLTAHTKHTKALLDACFSWRWRQDVLPKRLWTSGTHDVTSQKHSLKAKLFSLHTVCLEESVFIYQTTRLHIFLYGLFNYPFNNTNRMIRELIGRDVEGNCLDLTWDISGFALRDWGKPW